MIPEQKPWRRIDEGTKAKWRQRPKAVKSRKGGGGHLYRPDPRWTLAGFFRHVLQMDRQQKGSDGQWARKVGRPRVAGG